MTARCPGGGASTQRPGFSATLFIAPAALGALLNNVKTPWAVGIAGALGLITYDLSTYCTSDPPATPTMTPADYAALFSIDPVAHLDAVTKWETWLASILWDQFCHCVSGTAAPPLPSPADPGIGQTLGGTSFVLPMRRYQCKVKSLWNGSANVAPPAGWDAVGFNDSAWDDATKFVPAVSHTLVLIEERSGADVSSGATDYDPSVWGAEPVAPWVLPPSTQAEYVIRWYFTGPPLVPDDVYLTFYVDTDSQVVGGTFLLNGTQSGVLLNTLQEHSLTRAIQPGLNVLALWINGTTLTPTFHNTGHDWFTVALHASASFGQGSASDCCAQIQPLISQILNLLISLGSVPAELTALVHRLLPTTYMMGTAHGGLTGSASFGVANLLGIMLNVDVAPGYSGIEAANPNVLFDIGWVSLSTPDGLIEQRRINTYTLVWTPRLMSDATVIGYYLNPGVVATITELGVQP